MKKQFKADLLLLSVVISWGSTFVLTKNALQEMPTYNFLSVRFGVAALLLILIFVKKLIRIERAALLGGTVLGFLLFIGYAFQTVGLNYTTASKSAFITGFSAVLVPVLSTLILKKRPEFMAVLGVVCAIIGLGFLTLSDSLILNIGDLYTLLSTFAYALQIILIDKFTSRADSAAIATVEISVVAMLSAIFSFLFEKPVIPSTAGVWIAIFVTSVFATTYAFLVQSMAQKYTTPTHTALIFVGEPVFALLFAYILIGELLTIKQLTGCALILSGMLLSELKPASKKEKDGSAALLFEIQDSE